MTTKCSVCLESYHDAVSIPCGHIFCSACLHSHIGKTVQDGTTASCPTCRKDFSFVTPDSALIMKPLQKFVYPGIRKVYVDVDRSEINNLEAELEQCRRQIRTLTHQAEAERKSREAERDTEDLEDRAQQYARSELTTTRLRARIPVTINVPRHRFVNAVASRTLIACHSGPKKRRLEEDS
ncbi:hypothetical protein BDZ89DRAFT_1068932 [Hymenopellis radicata]|nr:hypothetical protein BDZ89DRAFT_1068932 [Hymenopellis radicata]